MTALETGFLLSYTKFGDQDAVLHCFTRENGYVSFFARGIYSAKNRKKTFLLPLNEICITVNRGRGSLPLISKIEQAGAHLPTDVARNAVIFFVADFLNHLLRNEDQPQNIYPEIKRFLNVLETGNFQSHHIFLFNFLQLQGFVPLLSDGIFLDPESGSFSSVQNHHLFDTEISTIWKELATKTDNYSVKIPAAKRKDFLDSLLIYYHYHVPDFRTPGSLEIIKQIFE